MTKKLFFLFLLCLPLANNAQEIKQDQILFFEKVAEPPLARGCKRKGTVQKQRNCTASYINNYVNRHFDMRLAEKIMKGEPLKLQAIFVISEEGKVEEAKATGGPQELNSHLEEILLSLKSFTPAVQDGKAVEVFYTVPVRMRFR